MKKSTGPFTLEIYGGSMLPVLNNGAAIKFTKPKKYRCGDIVVFERESGTVIAHRILFRTRNFVYIKGDSSVAIEKVKYTSLLGVVTEITDGGITNTVKRGIYLIPTIILSFLMNRIWKSSGSFKKASVSLPSRTLKAILSRRYHIA